MYRGNLGSILFYFRTMTKRQK